MKKHVLIFLFLPILIQAQEKHTISGTIKNQANGETLIGATIMLKGTSIGATTNEYGFYSITATKGDYTLIISYVGFTEIEKEIQLNANLKLNFELEEEADQLDEVVVTAERKKIDLKTPQMSVNKLSAQTIKQIPPVLGEVDLIKSIQLLPGVTNAGELASGFNVRGGAEDQNLVLLDEAIIYHASHLVGLFSAFNSNAIKDIKLYKGGIPARFGGRASSVLDIRQRDGNNKNFHVSGGISLISAKLTAEGPIVKNKGSFLLSGRRTYLDPLFLFTSEEGTKNNVNFHDLNFKANYTINDNNRLYLSGYFGSDYYNYSESESYDNYNESFFNYSYGNLSASLRWNHIFNSKLFSNLSLIYNQYNATNEDKNDGFYRRLNSGIENYHFKYDFKYYFSNRFSFNFGASGIGYDFHPWEIDFSDDQSNSNGRIRNNKFALESAAYLGIEHTITDRLTAQYGLRYSNFLRLGKERINEYENNLPVVYNSVSKVYERANPIDQTEYKSGEIIRAFGNLEPRLAVSYQLNEQSSIKASYNRMAQYVHLISKTTHAIALDAWAPSGLFLKPQLADQYALGYFRNFKDNMYSLEVETYYKTVGNRVDYIDGADVTAQNIERELLQGKSRAYGLEFLLRKNKGALTGWLAYTLSKSEQHTPGGAGGTGINNGKRYRTPYDRIHDLSFTGNYKLNEKWSFGANFVFQTGKPTTYPNGQFRYKGSLITTYSNRNENRLPAYHRLDISAILTPRKNKNRKWKGEWVFSIYNLYARKNATFFYFEEENGMNKAKQLSIFGFLIPGITYNFKF